MLYWATRMRNVDQIGMCFALAVVTAAASMPLFSAETGLCVNSSDLAVKVLGRYSEQKLIFTVKNHTETSGRKYITLPLPEDGEVLGFSVEDEQGRMVDAICVPDIPSEATVASSSSISESAKATPNTVSIPVSVPPQGEKRIILHYTEPLKTSNNGDFTCTPYDPFERQKIRRSLQWQLPLPPLSHTSNGEKTQFTQQESYYVCNEVWNDATPHQASYVILPKSLPTASVEMADGVFYATLSSDSPAPRKTEIPSPETLSLVWDASASMPAEGTAAAIRFLKEYLNRAPNIKHVNLAVLRHRVEEITNFSVAEDGGKALTDYLASLKRDGATADLTEAVKALNPKDFCLIYSDGCSNFGTMHIPDVKCRVKVLLPEEIEDGLPPALARLNAEVICLNKGSAKEQVNAMSLSPWRIACIKLDGKEWSGVVYDPMKDPFATSFEIIGAVPSGKHYVEIEWICGNERLTEKYEFSADGAVSGLLLRSRYANLLARRALLEVSPLLRQSTMKSLSCLYKTAVTGYHWAHPSDTTPSANHQHADVDALAQKWRTHRNGTPTVLWLKRTAKNMVKQGVKELSREKELLGEATGKMPEWLKEDGGNHLPKSNRGKRNPRKNEGASVRENLIPRNPNASYMKKLQEAKAPTETYEKLRIENLRCPAFYAECSYFFATRGEKEKALSVLSNICELAPESLPLQASLAMRLMLMGEYDLAESCLLNILEKQEDTKQAYWMRALLEEHRGNTDNAAEILVRLLRLPKIDEGLAEAALISLNRLRINADRNGKPLKNGLIPTEWILPVDADLRMELLWDSFDSDVDLKVGDPFGNECDPEHPETLAGGVHSPDTTLGLGIESFTMFKAPTGEYAVSANIFGPVNQKRYLPVTLCLLVYFNYAKEDEVRSAHIFRLEQNNGTADLGVSVLGGEFRNSSEAE